MKTAEEFYKEIATSKELQEELKAVTKETLDAFLAKHGCNVTAKDFTAVVSSLTEGEIEDVDAADVAGGFNAPSYLQDVKMNPGKPPV